LLVSLDGRKVVDRSRCADKVLTIGNSHRRFTSEAARVEDELHEFASDETIGVPLGTGVVDIDVRVRAALVEGRGGLPLSRQLARAGQIRHGGR
jgi:hypothetical protein